MYPALPELSEAVATWEFAWVAAPAVAADTVAPSVPRASAAVTPTTATTLRAPPVRLFIDVLPRSFTPRLTREMRMRVRTLPILGF